MAHACLGDFKSAALGCARPPAGITGITEIAEITQVTLITQMSVNQKNRKYWENPTRIK
jgi:hypothetical protein